MTIRYPLLATPEAERDRAVEIVRRWAKRFPVGTDQAALLESVALEIDGLDPGRRSDWGEEVR